MRATGTGSRLAIGAAALALFVVAIELLKTGAGSLEPLIRGVLTVSGPASSLGFGWLLAYVVLSGSPVAATAIGLFAGHLVTPLETFFMIGGSRLGAPMVVLLIGAIYRLRGASRKTSLMAGVLSLVVTFTIYVPALGLGFFLFQSGAMEAFAIGTPGEITGIIDLTAGRFAGYAIATVGGLATVLLGIGSVVAAIALFDRAIPPLDPHQTRVGEIATRIYRPGLMFLLGMGVTTLTLSVSVSLSLLVPLSAKGYVRRENFIPYIMGANVTTFVDTLLAAVVAGAGISIVAALMFSVTVVSFAVILIGYPRYEAAVLSFTNSVVASTRTLVLFLSVLFAVPIALLML